MAQYTTEQLQKNRQTVAFGTFAVVAGLTLLVAVGLIETSTGLGFGALGLGTAAILWWLFASKKAGNIDGSWVDGWDLRHGTEQTTWWPLMGFSPETSKTRGPAEIDQVLDATDEPHSRS